MGSRVICIQSPPTNTVRWDPVTFIAHSISSAFSRIKYNSNSKTTPQWNLPIWNKTTQRQKPTPLPTPNPTLGMSLRFYSNTAFPTLPALLGWTESPTVIMQRQVSRRQARWKTKEICCESFQCAYETGQKGSVWPGSQGQCGTRLAVKHICTQKTRVDSKIDQSYVSSLVIKNGIL